ncbi:MAG: glycosyltransferase [Phycisphaerae bacterium]
MDDTDTPTLNPAVFDANLTALWAGLPDSAEVVAGARLPDSMKLVTGRDGATTFSWLDDAGSLHWLGRTSMPSISCPALLDSFDPGSGNVLLVGLGQGAELRLLLDRMAAHQAVMVVEPTAWAVAAALRLRDFSAAIQQRRLLIFTGKEPWGALSDFLKTHVGFLVPDRVLSWPWFDTEEIAHASERLSGVQTAIARDRTADAGQHDPISGISEIPGVITTQASGSSESGLAILSSVTDTRAHRFARLLSHAAAAEGLPHCCCVLDQPACVHPAAQDRAVRSIEPKTIVLIDGLPESMSIPSPDVSMWIMCSHALPLSQDWLKRIPDSTWLGVRTEDQRQHAIGAGLSQSHVIVLPPAAVSPRRSSPAEETRIAVIGDLADTSASAVGLHLVSHCRLWTAAEGVLDGMVDTYQDEDAERVLEAAERKTRIRLTSDEVRRGIVERIRQTLGPSLVRRAYCEALADAGFAFDLYGTGWDRHPRLRACDRGPWPTVGDEAAATDAHGLILSIETSGHVVSPFVDGLAAGLAGFTRRHPLDTTANGLAAILDPDTHVWRFDSRKDMVNCITKAMGEPDSFADRRARAAAYINEHHTWSCRLRKIINS